jgi:hypothetical protein
MSSWPYYLPSGNQKGFELITLAAEHRLSLRAKIWALRQVAVFETPRAMTRQHLRLQLPFAVARQLANIRPSFSSHLASVRIFTAKSLDRYQPIRFGSLLDRLLKVS